MEYVVQVPENWKIGIHVSIKKESETAEPVVLLELPLENGAKKVVELSVKQFHLLRLQTAVSLSELIDVREKLTPVVYLLEKSRGYSPRIETNLSSRTKTELLCCFVNFRRTQTALTNPLEEISSNLLKCFV